MDASRWPTLPPHGKGVVKILDFGLAKAMDPPPSQDGNPEDSPTLTIGETQAGTILGTAAYMVPEQAKGKAADRRSDIWSFGVILHEVLTGKRLFPGESAVEILGEVLNKEPDISAAPARAHKLLRWCLEKDRKQRLASISDAHRLLAEDVASPPAATKVWRLGRHPLVWTLGLLAAITSASLVFVLWNRPPAVQKTAARFTIPLPPGQEVTTYPAITRDGRTVAYVTQQGTDDSQLYLRDLNSFEARAVAGSGGAVQPFFSPDGKWVAFFVRGQLQKAEVTGGAPIRLAEAAYPFGGTWNDDNTIIYAGSLGSGLLRINSSGGTPESLTKPDGAAKGYAHVFPQALPGVQDGKEIFYLGPDGRLMAAEVTAQGGTLEVGQVGPLFGNAMAQGNPVYDVSPDGQRFLLRTFPEQKPGEPLTLVQNWTAGLKR